jgi:hypothetical protein
MVSVVNPVEDAVKYVKILMVARRGCEEHYLSLT